MGYAFTFREVRRPPYARVWRPFLGKVHLKQGSPQRNGFYSIRHQVEICTLSLIRCEVEESLQREVVTECGDLENNS